MVRGSLCLQLVRGAVNNEDLVDQNANSTFFARRAVCTAGDSARLLHSQDIDGELALPRQHHNCHELRYGFDG